MKSGNPLSLNARLSFTRWSYIFGNQHISFYSSFALNLFCKNKNLELIKYYKFRHAYGGISIIKLFKNLIKFIFKICMIETLIKKDYQIDLANDHFIAVIRKNRV